MKHKFTTLAIIAVSLFGLSNFSRAATTTGGVNWLDPLGYEKPQFVPITVPDEASCPNKYYINMDSGSGSTCSQSNPCSSIDSVIGKSGTAGGPAYIYVRGTGGISLYDDAFYGTVGNEIVIKPWPGYTATFSGDSNTNSSNVHDIIFDGGPNFGITFLANVSGRYAILIDSNNTTVYRTQGHCGTVAAAGVFGTGAWSKVGGGRYINNETYGCEGTGDQVSFIYAGPGSPNGGYSNLLIQNNLIRDMGGEGMEINPRVTSENLTISGNAIHNVGKVTCSTAWGCRPGITMSIQSGGGNNGTVIKNNLIWNTGSGCIWDRGGGTPKPVIYNNTCYDYADPGSDPWPQGIAGYSNGGTATIRNNIIYDSDGTNPFDSSSFSASNNLCASGKSCGSSSQIYSAGVFQSTDQNNANFLKLASGSVAIDHGYATSVTDSYFGTARSGTLDIGADEYSSSQIDTLAPQSPNNLQIR